ncbi:hypothetical protein Tco_0853182 [Tanacetum coccineum]
MLSWLALKDAPFEALYVENVGSPVCWAGVEKFNSTGPEIVQVKTENNHYVKAMDGRRPHDRQKSYTDLKRKPMELRLEIKVMLKVSLGKGVVRFGKTGEIESQNGLMPTKPLAIPFDGLLLMTSLGCRGKPYRDHRILKVKRLKRSVSISQGLMELQEGT